MSDILSEANVIAALATCGTVKDFCYITITAAQ